MPWMPRPADAAPPLVYAKLLLSRPQPRGRSGHWTSCVMTRIAGAGRGRKMKRKMKLPTGLPVSPPISARTCSTRESEGKIVCNEPHLETMPEL